MHYESSFNPTSLHIQIVRHTNYNLYAVPIEYATTFPLTILAQ